MHTRFLGRLQAVDEEKITMILGALEMLVDMLGQEEETIIIFVLSRLTLIPLSANHSFYKFFTKT